MSVATESPKPLEGWRVLVTRARAQASPLSDALRDRGADIIEMPSIDIVPASPAPLDAAIARLDTYAWIVFTSVNGVDAFFNRLDASGIATDVLRDIDIAVIGRGTAARLLEYGVKTDLIPEEFVAESLVYAMIERGVAGRRVLLPRAELARDTLPDGLRAAGATVDVVVAYRTRLPADIEESTVRLVRGGEIDAATFASPSTVRNLTELLGGRLASHIVIAAIGPITAAALAECGYRVDIQAREYSIPGLVAALSDFAMTHPRDAVVT